MSQAGMFEYFHRFGGCYPFDAQGLMSIAFELCIGDYAKGVIAANEDALLSNLTTSGNANNWVNDNSPWSMPTLSHYRQEELQQVLMQRATAMLLSLTQRILLNQEPYWNKGAGSMKVGVPLQQNWFV